MTTVKIKFCPSTVKGRPGSIVYVVTCHRAVRRVSSGCKVYPEEWDGLRACVVPVRAERVCAVRAVSRRLRYDVELLHAVADRLSAVGRGAFTAADVVAGFCAAAASLSLRAFMGEAVARLRQLGRERTAENYATTLNSFMRFMGNSDIRLNELDRELMAEYEAYLKARGIAMNTVSFYNRILRAAYNSAVERGLVVQRTPFKHVYTGVGKTAKRAISIDAIRRLKRLDLGSAPALDFARDMFLLSFYTRGMSFIDMAYLRRKDLHGGILTYRRRKTGQTLHVRWERCMQEIIDKHPAAGTPYLLPIIKGGGDARRQYLNAQRLVNNKLKRVAALAGLQPTLTMYVARHSWASIAKSNNIPLAVISEGMGHRSMNVTQIYLASLDTSAIDNANGLILGKL